MVHGLSRDRQMPRGSFATLTACSALMLLLSACESSGGTRFSTIGAGNPGSGSGGDIAAKLKDSEIYGFIDGAKIRVLDRAGLPAARYDLASAGGGLRLAYNPHASLSLEGARVIDTAFEGGDRGWRFNIGWYFKLRR